MTLLGRYHWFPDFWDSLHQKLWGDWRSFFQLSCESCQIWAALVDSLSLTFRSSSSHASSIRFTSSDCAGQPRRQLREVLFLYDFYVSLAEFSHKFLIIIFYEYKSSTSYKLCSKCDSVILLIVLLAGLIQCALHSVEIPDSTTGKSTLHHNSTSSMLYGWCHKDVVALSPTLRRSYRLSFDPNISTFDSTVQNTLFHCSIVQSLCALTHWNVFDIVLLPHQWFLDSNSAI